MQFVDVSSSKATSLCQHYDEGNDANGQHASKVKVEQQWTADELIIAQPSGNRRTFSAASPNVMQWYARFTVFISNSCVSWTCQCCLTQLLCHGPAAGSDCSSLFYHIFLLPALVAECFCPNTSLPINSPTLPCTNLSSGTVHKTNEAVENAD